MSFTALDWFIVVVLAGGLVRGFMVGAVRQVMSLAGLVVAFFASVQFMRPVGEMVVASLGVSEEVAPLVGFVVLFVGVQAVMFALSRLVESLLESLSLGIVNRAAGSLLGGFKAALLLSVLFLVLGYAGYPDADAEDQSTLYGPVATSLPQTWDAAAGYLPMMKQVSEQFGARVRNRLDDDPAPEANPDGRDATRIDATAPSNTP